jgi:glutaminyl-tRNA synthetase
VDENLDLLQRMKDGEFEEGQHVLRAKIDMTSGNQNLRDPLMYRIMKAEHHRTGNTWSIYPMYDFAHGQSDAIEGVTHSLCTLEFEAHRPLYEWFLDHLPVPSRPRQIEFAPLQLNYTILSKRKLRQLVHEGQVNGWDDPRMPTLRGLRRAGVPPEVIRGFCEHIGVARREGVVEIAVFEHMLREHLNRTAPRAMAVLRPLEVEITNWPEGHVEHFEVPNNPENPADGSRMVPFSRKLWIERDDFRDDAPKKWFRLAPGAEVRLRSACLLRCDEVDRNTAGEPIRLRCTWDPGSRGGTSPDGRKVKGTLHWVSAQHAVNAQVRLYDRLFATEQPGAGDRDFLQDLNPHSLEVIDNAKLEPGLEMRPEGWVCQFERLGYFCIDRDSSPERPVFNRTIGLRDSWSKAESKG